MTTLLAAGRAAGPCFSAVHNSVSTCSVFLQQQISARLGYSCATSERL